MNAKESAALYVLTQTPELLEKVTIKPEIFKGQSRDIFDEITRQFQESQSFNDVEAADNLKMTTSNFIDLFKGCYKFKASQLEHTLKKIEAESLSSEILTLVKKELQTELKTGTQDELKRNKIRQKFNILDGLNDGNSSNNEPMTVKIADVEEEEIKWLWPNYIPFESMTLISGDPNAGKSWFLCDMSARVTKGTAWPDSSPNAGPANVYYMTYEDDIQKILKKRIRTLGGDQARFFAYNSKSPLYLSLSTEEGLKKLEAELLRIGGIRLIVIDPVLDFITAQNPNAIEMVRALLTPLISMSERLHFALMIVTHLNKDQMKSAIYRAGGSTGGWTGKSRATFLICRDPEEKMRRYLMPIKNNYAFPEPEQMEFEIVNSRLEYRACDVDINKILNPSLGRPPGASLEITEMLTDMFKDRDEIPAVEIEESVKSIGKGSISTLKRVKNKQGYISELKKADNKEDTDFWVWKKPYFKE